MGQRRGCLRVRHLPPEAFRAERFNDNCVYVTKHVLSSSPQSFRNLTDCENPKPKFLNPKQSTKLKLETASCHPFGELSRIEIYNLFRISSLEIRIFPDQ
jgi:hypothetical protein